MGRWTVSKWKDNEGTSGKWVANAGKWHVDEAEDTGIQTGEDSKFFGIAAGFDSFSNEGKELIIQYQAKYEKDVECSGGYAKRTHLIFNFPGKNVLKKSDLSYKQD